MAGPTKSSRPPRRRESGQPVPRRAVGQYDAEPDGATDAPGDPPLEPDGDAAGNDSLAPLDADGAPDGETVVISPQATTFTPPAGASEAPTDSDGAKDAAADEPADALAPATGDSDEVAADAAAPPAPKIAIACGVDVRSEIDASIVAVDEAPVIGPRSKVDTPTDAPADGLSDAAADAPADAPTLSLPIADGEAPTAAEAGADSDGAAPEGLGTLSHVPAKTVPDRDDDTSTPVSASATVVFPAVSDRTAPPATELPPIDWNWTKACGSPDGSDDGRATLGSGGRVGSGVAPAWHAANASPSAIVNPAPANLGAKRGRRGVIGCPLAGRSLVAWSFATRWRGVVGPTVARLGHPPVVSR